MAIPDHARANFKTLLRAAADGNLALMEAAQRRLSAFHCHRCQGSISS